MPCDPRRSPSSRRSRSKFSWRTRRSPAIARSGLARSVGIPTDASFPISSEGHVIFGSRRCRSACESRRRVRNRCGIAASAAPRGRDSGRGQVVKWLSSNGRSVALLSRHPDPAQVRYFPSTRIPSPSHAAAAACLATSGAPAFGTLRAARSRRTLRTTTWCAATPVCSPAGAVSRARGSLAVGGMPPPARYRERGVPCLCDASTAYAALSQRGTV